ncbi:MAG: hypothetical protein AAF657_30685 [Acidobacteriota bacterium]
MKKKQTKKLVLAHETLKHLTTTKEEDLKAAVGGTLAPVCFTEFCNTGSLCYC